MLAEGFGLGLGLQLWMGEGEGKGEESGVCVGGRVRYHFGCSGGYGYS